MNEQLKTELIELGVLCEHEWEEVYIKRVTNALSMRCYITNAKPTIISSVGSVIQRCIKCKILRTQ